MRIHELAKVLNVSPKQLMSDFRKMRVAVKSHMSSVEDKAVRKIMALYEKRRAEEERKRKEQEERRKIEEQKRREEEERRRKEEEERRKKEEEERKKQEAAEREAARVAALEKKRQERKLARERHLKKRQPVAAAPSAPASAPSPPAAAAPESPAAVIEKEKIKEPADTELRLPTIEVMKFKPSHRARGPKEEKGGRKARKGRKKSTSAAQEPEKEGRLGRVAIPPPEERRIRPRIFVRPSVAAAKTPSAVAVPPKEKKIKHVQLHGETTVGQFSEKIGVPSAELIKKILLAGEALTINEVMPPELIELIAPEFGVEVEILPEEDEYNLEKYLTEDSPESLRPRPPVVTIMGHVDHGKTTLLDNIRKSKIAEGEFGGITQHIGAYDVETPTGQIVFLDTPGHEAFTSMRARGASTTDIVVLVVAANDGVMPQTIEAINHARAANVPIVVAINKIDLPGANPERVKQDLLKYNLVPEALGGDTIFAEISAKYAQGIDQLLEMILLQAEVLELKANPDRPAVGRIIEAHIDPLRGAVATVLVQNGALHLGDAFFTGGQYGRVRAMIDDRGRAVKSALPSHPVEIIGLGGTPAAGELFVVVPSEKVARRIAELRTVRKRLQSMRLTRHVTLEKLHEYIEEGKIKELHLILKADVEGSLEAVTQSLMKLSGKQVRINILHAAVGAVGESDVNLAIASDAIIIGFNVRPEPRAAQLAEKNNIEIRLYRVIYELLENIKQAMLGLLESQYKEVARGRAEVRQIFRITGVGNIAGSVVADGEIAINSRARLLRDGVVINEGRIGSLRRLKDDVSKVAAGLECGIGLENYNDIKEGDIIETYELEEVKPQLDIP
jgi:translation initiation factor IF-2